MDPVRSDTFLAEQQRIHQCKKVHDGMRTNTVGSNGMGAKSDRLMKEALLVNRIIISEQELSEILTSNNFAGQKWWHIHYW